MFRRFRLHVQLLVQNRLRKGCFLPGVTFYTEADRGRLEIGLRVLPLPNFTTGAIKMAVMAGWAQVGF